MREEPDDEYLRQLRDMLGQFPPISEDARKRLIKTYESIDLTAPADEFRESA